MSNCRVVDRQNQELNLEIRNEFSTMSSVLNQLVKWVQIFEKSLTLQLYSNQLDYSTSFQLQIASVDAAIAVKWSLFKNS